MVEFHSLRLVCRDLDEIVKPFALQTIRFKWNPCKLRGLAYEKHGFSEHALDLIMYSGIVEDGVSPRGVEDISLVCDALSSLHAISYLRYVPSSSSSHREGINKLI